MNGRVYQYLLPVAFLGIVMCHCISKHTGQKISNPDVEILDDQRVIALTFDDGPSVQTVFILDILKKYQVRATFFVIGKNAERNPVMLKRIIEEGHIVGGHTYSHSVLSSVKTPRQIGIELDKTFQVIFKNTGVASYYFRPPFGWDSPWMLSECNKKGYTSIKWTIDPKDWQHPSPDSIISKVIRLAHDRAIVLLHDGHQTDTLPNISETVQALPGIIEKLKEKKYRFVGIDEILTKRNFLVSLDHHN